MSKIAISLYIIEVLHNLNISVSIVCLILTIPFTFLMLYWLIEKNNLETSNLNNLIKTLKSISVSLCCAIIISILIPKKETMYIMLGLYTSEKIIENVAQDDLFIETKKLLKEKITEALKSKTN